MVRQHHQLSEYEFEQTPVDSEGQGSLAHCSSWGRRVVHNLATEQQNQSVTADHKTVLAFGVTELHLTKQDKTVESTRNITCLYKADVQSKECKYKPACF